VVIEARPGPCSTCTQEKEEETIAMQAQLEQIGIVVEDMARSLAFYRLLGLDLPADADEQAHVDTELPGGLRLAWDTVETIRSFDPDWQPPTGGHRVALSFRFASPADVDAAYEELVGRGHRGHKAPWDAFWGQRYAMVDDPDGNVIDLFAPSG
jgi:catechol 2,3-dioxygenase-like lactoylglutathione lyase family enzyme